MCKACLVHAIQELQKDGRETTALAAGGQVGALAELVAEGQPLLLQQHLEALQGPVERVAQQLDQGHHLEGERNGEGERERTSARDTKRERERERERKRYRGS